MKQAEEGPCGAGGIWAVLTNGQWCCTDDIVTACQSAGQELAQAAPPAG